MSKLHKKSKRIYGKCTKTNKTARCIKNTARKRLIRLGKKVYLRHKDGIKDVPQREKGGKQNEEETLKRFSVYINGCLFGRWLWWSAAGRLRQQCGR